MFFLKHTVGTSSEVYYVFSSVRSIKWTHDGNICGKVIILTFKYLLILFDDRLRFSEKTYHSDKKD